MNPKRLFRFGPYTLDAGERVLLRDREPVALPPKDLETLLVLVENSGHIVEKDELLERVWPGVFIEEGNLARRVFNLRQALGDDASGRPYIETIPKRGYRFSSSVIVESEPEAAEIPPAAVPSPTRPKARRILWWWPVVLSLSVALAAIVASRFLLSSPGAPVQRVMLAVVPFQNLSGDERQEYFADGLTEELIAQLGEIQPKQLGVIARSSVMKYKSSNATAAQIGKDLGVGYLLEGSVRRGGDRVRITAQLIRASEQTHLWAESYERPLTDVLTIQREIAEKVTHSLSVQLLPSRTVGAVRPLNVESYDKYLLGLHDLGVGTQESIGKGIQHFQEAIAASPDDARLYSSLGEAYESANTYYSSPKDGMPHVKAAAQRALQLDPEYASAHVLMGDVNLFFEWRWPEAEAEYRHALEINPSLPAAQLGYASYLGTLGRFDEALDHVRQAYVADPIAIDSRNDALWVFYFSGRMQGTVEQCRQASELQPTAALPYALLAMAESELGHSEAALQAAQKAEMYTDSPSILATAASALARANLRAEANRLLSKALKQAEHKYVCRFIVAAAYAELGEKEKAFESLETGYRERST